MIHIQGIDHVVLRVTDLNAMLEFYCNVLGCTIERQQQELGLTQLRAGTSLIDLVTVEGKLGREGGAGPGPEGRNMDHFCVRIDPFDVETINGHLRTSGIEPGEVSSRYLAEGEGPSIYIIDPEGNMVELKGAPGDPNHLK